MNVYSIKDKPKRKYNRKKKTEGTKNNIGILDKISGWLWICIACTVLGGCGVLQGIYGGAESPRPKKYQVEATKEIVTTNVAEIMKGQLGKQEGIEAVALAALLAIVDSKNPIQIEGITNIVANTSNAIRKADGSAELLSRITDNANEGITKIDLLNYMMYAGSAVAMGNREELAQGIKTGFQWTASKVLTIASGGIAGGGLLGTLIGFIRSSNRKGTLLKTIGNITNEFNAKDHVAGKTLKTMIAEAVANQPINAKRELGI